MRIHAFGKRARIAFIAALCAALCGALAGCGAPFDTYPTTQQVRTDYSKRWADRAATYRQALPEQGATAVAVAATFPDAPLSAADIAEARTSGALDVIEAFAAFRQFEPLLSATETWLGDRVDAETDAIRALGLSDDQLRQLAATDLRQPVDGVPERARAALAFRTGALNELGLILRDLVEFRDEYRTAYRFDSAHQPPPPKRVDSTTIDALVNAAIAGSRIAHGTYKGYGK